MPGKKSSSRQNDSKDIPEFPCDDARDQFIHKAWKLLKKHYGIPQPPLKYSQPHELAIAVILSAQCTDDRVNIVTKDLFQEYGKISDYYKKPLARLEKMIYSTGFYKNKAKSIRGFAKKLEQEYNGNLPNNLAELVQFPGIGRKTANVVQQVLFGRADGIVVDTHVARLARRFGLTRAAKDNALQIENDLMQVLPKKYWYDWSLYMIFLGREFCNARSAKCEKCILNQICLSSSLVK